MTHLTDEQLSALLDDALPASARAAADAHLSGCDACRARLAELSALDAALGKALTHDPGEAYFADFAERVAKRIVAEPAPPAPKARWWFASPRGLTLAGSTAALLVAAGLAWMQFHNEQDVARALREARPTPAISPSLEQSAPGDRDEARPHAQQPPAVGEATPPAASERARFAAPAPTAGGGMHLKEVPTADDQLQAKTQATRQEPSANALAAPAAGSAIAQIKRRAVAPAAEGAATAPARPPHPSSEESGAPAADLKQEGAPAQKDADRAPAPAPAPAFRPVTPAVPPPAGTAAAPHAKAAVGLDTTRGQSFEEWNAAKHLHGGRTDETKLVVNGLSALAAHCGKVRDSRGKVVAGAQVTAVHNGVRTARTDADGEFCVDSLQAGDTLTVMHVGFDPYTVVMTPMTSLAITLEPVGTLGPNSTMLLGKGPSSPMSFTGGARGSTRPADSVAPPADVYAAQSAGIRQLVRDARDATSVAHRERTAPAYERAAKDWASVLGQVKGAPADDARFQYVSALRAAYQLEPTSEREGRLRSAITAFLALTPAKLPERATVERWEAELNAAPGR